MQIAVEPGPPLGLDIFGLGQDRRRRAHCTDRRQHFVQGLAQMRIMRDPVVQRRHRPIKLRAPTVALRQHLGPAGKPRHELVDPLDLGPQLARSRARLDGCRRPQILDQRVLGAKRQRRRVDPQSRGQPRQNRRPDPPPVMLDQIEI